MSNAISWNVDGILKEGDAEQIVSAGWIIDNNIVEQCRSRMTETSIITMSFISFVFLQGKGN